MSVRSLMITAAAISAAAALQAPANAATVVQLTPTVSMFTSLFNGTFSDTTTFTNLTAGSLLSLQLGGSSSAALSAASLTATFNNVAIPLTYAGNSFSGLFTPAAGNINTLVLSGTNAGLGALVGTLNVVSAAVPEASSWAMMTLGFGVLGYSLRRRRTTFGMA